MNLPRPPRWIETFLTQGPVGKAAFAQWHSRTALTRLLPAPTDQLTSQRFWHHFHDVSEDQIRAIEADLCQAAVEKFGLDLRLLIFDPTNVFTFIDTFNRAPTLAQRGKSKEGRSNLRILGFGLMATADGPVPLLHDLYPGNRNDATEFPFILDRLLPRPAELPTFSGVRTSRSSLDAPDMLYVEYADGSREHYDLAGDPHQMGSLHADPSPLRSQQRDSLRAWLSDLKTCGNGSCQTLEWADTPGEPLSTTAGGGPSYLDLIRALVDLEAK